VSKETNRVLGHADEADGIEEYDNPLPDWWLGLFWFCIIWAIGYTVHYHFIADRSQTSAFEAEMAAAAERWPAQDAADLVFDMTPETMQAGQGVYETYCFVCHGKNAEALGIPLDQITQGSGNSEDAEPGHEEDSEDGHGEDSKDGHEEDSKDGHEGDSKDGHGGGSKDDPEGGSG
jgi:cbb3-type cytochrome c oxidase subunit III